MRSSSVTRNSLAWMFAILAAAGAGAAQKPRVLSVEPVDDDEPVAKDLEARVEVKISLRSAQIGTALKTFELDEARSAQRDIWFYDTAELSLFEDGLILRSRRGSKNKADTTIKIRPLGAERVGADWLEREGFKCEEDRVGARAVPSCSFTAPRAGADVDAVAESGGGVKKLFSQAQESFAEAFASGLPWRSLVALGPIDTRAWKVRTEDAVEPLVFELWQIGDGLRMLEVSTRADAGEAGAAAESLAKLLARYGLTADSLQETKTRSALQALVRARR